LREDSVKILMKKFLAVLFILVFAMSVAGSVSANEHIKATDAPLSGITDLPGLLDKIDLVTNFIFVILLVAAVIFIILGAFQFVTAGGKPESISEARQKIIYAIVGIVIALFAKAIPAVITNFLG